MTCPAPSGDAAGPDCRLADVIAHELAVVFCGINPGLRAAACGQHFAGRGNRFWKVLHLAGFTPRQLEPEAGRTLLDYRCGLTTAVGRPTARAAELSPGELLAARLPLQQKIVTYRPENIAFLGKPAYAAICNRRALSWGIQDAHFGGARVWLLPNPSGLNRSFSLERLVAAYRALQQAIT